MDRLDNHARISIFKYLDVRSRIRASQTCRQWRGLLQDSETLMDDVSEVYLEKWLPAQEKSEIPFVVAAFSQLKKCRQLKLGPGIAHGILSERRLKDEMVRFGKVVLISTGRNDSMDPYLQLLPSSVKHLQMENCSLDGFALNFPDLVQLEGFDLKFYEEEFYEEESEANAFALPLTLTRYGYIYYDCVASYYFPGPLGFGRIATAYFLENLRVGPLLSELNIGGLYFNEESVSSLLRIIRYGAPNLRRISFQVCGFRISNMDALIKKFTAEQGQDSRPLPFEWIKFDGPYDDWANAIKLLLQLSNVETLVVNLRLVYRYISNPDLKEIYDLTPMIKKKGIKLELMIKPVDPDGIGNPEGIPVPSELSSVLTNLELIDFNHHSRLLEVMLADGDSYELLTEIRLERCIGLGDAALEIVAKSCKNLKKLMFQSHRDVGPDSLTDQCLVPFLTHWDIRKSAQLSIECLKPALPFDGFNLPIDQEKGDFQDGKKWMVFRKSCLLDGCDELGTRLVIWDPEDRVPKSMVITNYKRSFDYHIKISVIDGEVIMEEKRGAEF